MDNISSAEIAPTVIPPNVKDSLGENNKIHKPDSAPSKLDEVNSGELAAALNQIGQLRQFQNAQNPTRLEQAIPQQIKSISAKPNILTRFFEWLGNFFRKLFGKIT